MGQTQRKFGRVVASEGLGVNLPQPKPESVFLRKGRRTPVLTHIRTFITPRLYDAATKISELMDR